MGNRCNRCSNCLRSLCQDQDSNQQDSLGKDSDIISVQLKRPIKQEKFKQLQLQRQNIPKSYNKPTQKSKFKHNNTVIGEDKLKQPKQPLLTLRISEIDSFKQSSLPNFYKYQKVKDRFKPTINKISTQEQEIGQYYVNQQFDSDSQEDNKIKRRKKVNMTFSNHQDSIVIGKAFRTLNHPPNINIQETIAKIEKEEGIEQKLNLQIQTAKYFFENKQYEECEEHLMKGMALSKEIKQDKDGYQLKVQLLKLYGCKRLLQNKINQSLQFFKEVQKISENQKCIYTVDLHYWLGECFLRQFKIKLAKTYLNKALNQYFCQKIEDQDLLVMLYLQLGNLYFKEQQFAQADKFYSKGIKLSENSGNSTRYLQLLLKKACTYMQMDNYKKSVVQFSKLFKNLRQNNLNNRPIYAQSQQCYKQILDKLPEAVISQNQLNYIIKITEELQIYSEGVSKLKNRLKKMRQILYKE